MKKQNYVLVSLLVLLCLSACQNAPQEEAELQTVVQEEAQPIESEQPQAAVQEEGPQSHETIQEESPLPQQPAEEEIQQTVQPLDLSDYDLQFGQQEEFLKIYEQIQTVEQAENFEGTWYRTDTASSLEAELAITEQTTEGFSFAGEFFYYSHSGWMEGKAFFAAPNVAVYEHINDWEEEISPEYLVFEKTTEGMKVYASSASADLGFGMNVFAHGNYVQGEPVYTNATVLEDNFTAEAREKIQSLLGKEYDEYFKFAVEMGVLTSTSATLEDGSSATYYDVFVPTMGGYEFTLLVCENGNIYFNSEAVGWKTNVDGAIDFPVYTLAEDDET